MTVDVGPPIRVEVHDGEAATEEFHQILAEAAVPPEASATSGRGIELVHHFASRLGVANDPDGGKVVWFEVTMDSARRSRGRSDPPV